MSCYGPHIDILNIAQRSKYRVVLIAQLHFTLMYNFINFQHWHFHLSTACASSITFLEKIDPMEMSMMQDTPVWQKMANPEYICAYVHSLALLDTRLHAR